MKIISAEISSFYHHFNKSLHCANQNFHKYDIIHHSAYR